MISQSTALKAITNLEATLKIRLKSWISFTCFATSDDVHDVISFAKPSSLHLKQQSNVELAFAPYCSTASYVTSCFSSAIAIGFFKIFVIAASSCGYLNCCGDCGWMKTSASETKLQKDYYS